MLVLTRDDATSADQPRSDAGGVPGMRARPECRVIGVRHGVTPSDKPPVRIFLGTEPAQHRAERIFLWSIEQVRDPARVYEIFLMSDLSGFHRLLWLTGFTNYRFAIPHFAGATGRAIYNDTDQIYLADPAELFDLPMNDHGYLAIGGAKPDTSVMLLDCEHMAKVWPLEQAQRGRKNRLIAQARAVDGLEGPLPPEWNARDEEYSAGQSKLLHYTGIHTQPWRPHPERYVYFHNPVGGVWTDLEHAADQARYQLYDFDRPSARFSDVAARLRHAAGHPATAAVDVGDLVTATEAASVLEFGLGIGGPAFDLGDDVTIERHDPAGPTTSVPGDHYHGVVCRGGLSLLPDADVCWVIEALFARAEHFVVATVEALPGFVALSDGSRLATWRRDPSWWFALFEACGERNPELSWRVEVKTHRHGVYTRQGGRRQSPPTVWVLTDSKPGHTTQSVGLAEALGWPYEIKSMSFTLLAGIGTVLRSRLGATRLGVDRAASDALAPPWPDVVIATGWRPAPVTRWIGEQSRGRTRTIQLGRKGGRVADVYDVVVACGYFRLPPHPRRIETSAPLNRVTAGSLEAAGAAWPDLFERMAAPHIALLFGGSSRRHDLGPELARRIGTEVRAFADAAGGSIFAVTSRRSGKSATDALVEGFGDALGETARLDRWRDNRPDNPYLACLALADVIVVTGESESMVAEATACGKPVYIYPVPEKPPGFWNRVEEFVVNIALARRRNRCGTLKPQGGVQRFCARLIGRGLVQPRRNLHLLHQALFEGGLAKPFGSPLETGTRPALHEAHEVAAQVRQRLNLE
ncbi:MAG: ELM1/GtrOC1 family putative glycosyltransferase [Alphaproteobacteria bacterium]